VITIRGRLVSATASGEASDSGWEAATEVAGKRVRVICGADGLGGEGAARGGEQGALGAAHRHRLSGSGRQVSGRYRPGHPDRTAGRHHDTDREGRLPGSSPGRDREGSQQPPLRYLQDSQRTRGGLFGAVAMGPVPPSW
jgi:hypothetical protein